VNNKKDIQL